MEKEGTSMRAEDAKSVDFTTSSSDDPTKIPEKKEETEEDDVEYPTGLPLAFMILGLCLAVFVVALGASPSSEREKKSITDW
jgi:hypothetical protein